MIALVGLAASALFPHARMSSAPRFVGRPAIFMCTTDMNALMTALNAAVAAEDYAEAARLKKLIQAEATTSPTWETVPA